MNRLFKLSVECIVFVMFSMIAILGIASFILLVSIAIQTTIDLL